MPRFCPWPTCSEHRRRLRPGYRHQRHGWIRNRRGRPVRRFRCSTCGRTFSSQSFAFTYYMKRPELAVRIAAGLVAGCAHRQIARSLGCAPSTVTRLAARLGRHTLLLLARCLSEMGEIAEPIVFDHFETFELTQDYPFGAATAVGSSSWFVYALDPAPHGRAGRISPVQQERLQRRPPREHRGGYLASCGRVLDVLAPKCRARLELVSDDHGAYRRAVRRSGWRWRILHRVFPNPERGPKGSPSSPEARARDEAMFPCDLLHAILQHSMAAHHRETIAFGRRLNALMERLFLAAAWRNLVKGVSERKPDPTTPAMRIGLTSASWSWPRLLARRMFPEREHVPAAWMEIYRRTWINPALRSNRAHTLKNAF